MSQYAAISFTYNEQPATSKWNIVGTNFDYMQNALPPVGSILYYWGNSGAIPGYWMLANGATISDTESPINGLTVPNLVNVFLRGTTGNVRSTPQTGGSDTTTLSTTNLPAHSHTITDPGHSHSISDPGHSHNVFQDINQKSNGGTGGPYPAIINNSLSTSGSGMTTSTTGISINGASTGVSINNTGSGSAFNTLPSYSGMIPIIRFK